MYYYTAMALEKTGDFPGALENYQQAAHLEPIAAQPQFGAIPRAYVAEHYIGIAKTLARLGRTDEVCRQCRQSSLYASKTVSR